MTTQTYYEGEWHEGNIKLFGVEEIASWLGMSVFDGLRSFDGMFPDADLHCQRSIRSAQALGIHVTDSWERLHELCIDGINRFASGTDLYIRIEFWDQTKYANHVTTYQEIKSSTGFAIVIEELPLTRDGFTANMSTYTRCDSSQAPTNAKASCLYPAGIIAARKANSEGFDDCVMRSPNNRVAEFTMSNIFHVNGSNIITPQSNDTFLNGITRQRFIKLFEDDGWNVEYNRDVFPAELDHADEIFSTGNSHKIEPVLKYKEKELGLGRVAAMGWELYLDYAQQFKI